MCDLLPILNPKWTNWAHICHLQLNNSCLWFKTFSSNHHGDRKSSTVCIRNSPFFLPFLNNPIFHNLSSSFKACWANNQYLIKLFQITELQLLQGWSMKYRKPSSVHTQTKQMDNSVNFVKKKIQIDYLALENPSNHMPGFKIINFWNIHGS